MKKWWSLAVVVLTAGALSACSSSQVFTADPGITKSRVPSVEQNTVPPGQLRASSEALETGKRKWRVGNNKNALKAFKRSIEKNPYNFEAHYWLGLINRDHHNRHRSRALLNAMPRLPFRRALMRRPYPFQTTVFRRQS